MEEESKHFNQMEKQLISIQNSSIYISQTCRNASESVFQASQRRFPVAFKFKIQKVYIVFGAGLRLFRFGSGVRLIFMSDLSRYKNNNKCEQQQQQQRRPHAQQERDREKEGDSA